MSYTGGYAATVGPVECHRRCLASMFVKNKGEYHEVCFTEKCKNAARSAVGFSKSQEKYIERIVQCGPAPGVAVFPFQGVLLLVHCLP